MDRDFQLRLAAFARLGVVVQQAGGVLTPADLDRGFEFQGERIKFWDARRGIWRPRQLGSEGAALTIVTAPPKVGRTPKYDDQVGSARGEFVYRYEGSDPELWTNRAVRQAYLEGRPLIYLYGIAAGKYEALFPCMVIGDDPADLAFHVTAEPVGRLVTPSGQAAVPTPEKRIGRSMGSEIRTLGGLRLPHNQRFFYLKTQFGSRRYWSALKRVLEDSGSVYGLACTSLALRGGLTPVTHLGIVSGSPTHLKGHISSDRIWATLEHIELLKRYSVSPAEDFVAFNPRMDDNVLPHPLVHARLMAERVLLLAVRDWLRKLGLASYDSVKLRPTTPSDAPPEFAHLQWDLSAPCYVHPIAARASSGLQPGFVVADTVLVADLDERQARYFLNKCDLAWRQRNARPMLALLIADRFTKEALHAGRRKGALFCTPGALLGEEVAQALTALVGVLSNAAKVASSDPGKLDRLISTLARIEGAANTLRGPLFEFIVGMCVREHEGNSIDMGLVINDPTTGERAEIDVLRVKGREEVCAYECKGPLPSNDVGVEVVKDWLTRQVPRIGRWIRAQQRFAGSNVGFSFWTSSSLTPEARALLQEAAAATRKYKVTWKEGDDVYRYAEETRSQYATKLLNDHFRMHPLEQQSGGIGEGRWAK